MRASSLRVLMMGAALLVAAPLRAQVPPTPAPASEAETLSMTDAAERMTVPVRISGRGPFRFIVDTGSERTVISNELARELALGPGDTVTVHSLTEVSQIPTVVIPELEVGRRRTEDIHAPALPRIHLGAAGMIGADSLQRQRVDFDFVRREMTISPAHRDAPRWPAETIVITARSRFGRLVLVDASVDGERVYAIVDTGAEYTVANEALRQRLRRKGRLGAMVPVELASVTGGVFTADATLARRLRIGGVDIENLPVAFAAVHLFRQLDLEDRPAILLGMDALRLFERVSVDFANRRVRLVVPDATGFGPRHMAANASRSSRPPARRGVGSRSWGNGPSRP